MKKYLIIFLIVLIAQSCIGYQISKKFAPAGFSYKYDGENTGLDTLLFLHGYFMTEKVYDASIETHERFGIDGHYYATRFYPDGLVCSVSSSDSTNIAKAFSEDSDIKDWLYWGRYIVSGDTIKVQYIFDNDVMSSSTAYSSSKTDYIIAGRSTVFRIPNAKEQGTTTEPVRNKYNFYPMINSLSPANCPWLKKEWFSK